MSDACCWIYRDSILQVEGATSETDYNNISPGVLSSKNVAGHEEALYTYPHRDVAALNLCGIKGDQRKVII